MWTTLWIGGRLRAADVAKLTLALDIYGPDGCSDDDDRIPTNGQALHLWGDRRFGSISDALERTLQELELTYRVHCEPDGEFGGQIVQWSPGMASPEANDADEDEPIMALSKMKAMIAEGADADSLLAELERFAKPIPSIEIVPNDTPAPGSMETAGAK